MFTKEEKILLHQILDEKKFELVLLLNRINRDSSAFSEVCERVADIINIKDKVG